MITYFREKLQKALLGIQRKAKIRTIKQSLRKRVRRFRRVLRSYWAIHLSIFILRYIRAIAEDRYKSNIIAIICNRDNLSLAWNTGSIVSLTKLEQDKDLEPFWLYEDDDGVYLPSVGTFYLPFLWYTYLYETFLLYLNFITAGVLYIVTILPFTTPILALFAPWLQTNGFPIWGIAERVSMGAVFHTMGLLFLANIYIQSTWAMDYWTKHFASSFGYSEIDYVIGDLLNEDMLEDEDRMNYYLATFNVVSCSILLFAYWPIAVFLSVGTYFVVADKKAISLVFYNAHEEEYELVKQSQVKDFQTAYDIAIGPALADRAFWAVVFKYVFPFYPVLFGAAYAKALRILFLLVSILQNAKKLFFKLLDVTDTETYHLLKASIEKSKHLRVIFRALEVPFRKRPFINKSRLKSRIDVFFEKWFSGDLQLLRSAIHYHLTDLWLYVSNHPYYNREALEELEFEYDSAREERRLHEDDIDDPEDFDIAETETDENIVGFAQALAFFSILHTTAFLLCCLLVFYGIEYFLASSQELNNIALNFVLDDHLANKAWEKYWTIIDERFYFMLWANEEAVLITDFFTKGDKVITQFEEVEVTRTQYADFIRYYIYRFKLFIHRVYLFLKDLITNSLALYKKQVLKDVLLAEWNWFVKTSSKIWQEIESFLAKLAG